MDLLYKKTQPHSSKHTCKWPSGQRVKGDTIQETGIRHRGATVTVRQTDMHQLMI